MLGLKQFVKTKLEQRARTRLFRVALNTPPPTTFTNHPEPTDPGNYAKGLRWLSGEYFHDHQMLSAPEGRIWDMAPVSFHVLNRLHSFDWMNDLAAVGTVESETKIRDWTKQWLERYYQGEGPGWTPEVAAWRLIRLLTHTITLLRNSDIVSSERYYQSLGIHVHFLSEEFGNTEDGIARFAVLVAWLFASLSLENYAQDMDDLIELINLEAESLISGDEITLQSRNPEELSEIFCLLVWIDAALKSQDIKIGSSHRRAIEIVGATLRALRLGTGKLVEIHGGGPGYSSAIERALLTGQVAGINRSDQVLGYAQVRANQLYAIMDCASPPSAPKLDSAHASTNALWISDGNQQLIGSKGCAKNHILNARIASQETDAHSTLIVNSKSSSTLEFAENKVTEHSHGAYISRAANSFDFTSQQQETANTISNSHDGYSEEFGLSHVRNISIDRDGAFFAGVDILKPHSEVGEAKVQKLLDTKMAKGIEFKVQFILGPKFQASLDMNSKTVSVYNTAGKTWVFQQQGGSIEIQDTIMYDVNRLNPIPTKAIVVHSRLTSTSGFVSWSFQAF